MISSVVIVARASAHLRHKGRSASVPALYQPDRILVDLEVDVAPWLDVQKSAHVLGDGHLSLARYAHEPG